MPQNVETAQDRVAPANDRKLSHALFVVGGLSIIGGGLWFLYQNTAPYHPEFYVDDIPLNGGVDS